MNRAPVAVLGGTGPFGRALAHRLAGGGAEVRIGSRDAGRAAAAAARIRGEGEGLAVSGTTNRGAAEAGDPVFLTVPFEAQAGLLAEVGPALDGKLVICCGVIWPPGSRPATSAGEEAARSLAGSGARVAAAFQTVAAGSLRADAGEPPLPDVLVFADRKDDRATAARAAALTGLRAVPVGPLAAARGAEAALGLLLRLNRGGARNAGLFVTGLDG